MALQQGIDIKRGEGGTVVIPFVPLDSSGAPITSGDATVYIAELQEDGSLHTLDFDDNTFKGTTCTTPTTTASPQTMNGGAKEPGVFTLVLTEAQQEDFQHGSQYVLYVEHDDLVSPYPRWFQWGGTEGDEQMDTDEKVRRSPVGS
jgi:hypothetical protein